MLFLFDDKMDQDIKFLTVNCCFKSSTFVTDGFPLYMLNRRLLAYAHSFRANSWTTELWMVFLLAMIATTVSTKHFPLHTKYLLGT